MAAVYTDAEDERTINEVLVHGLGTPRSPKLRVLRIALARSLQIPTPPAEDLDGSSGLGGKEYDLPRITGAGLLADDTGRQDYDQALRAPLSVYHGKDMFQGDEADRRYLCYLQRHVRRGLREIRTTWHPGHDFHGFLYQELFVGAAPRPRARIAGRRSWRGCGRSTSRPRSAGSRMARGSVAIGSISTMSITMTG